MSGKWSRRRMLKGMLGGVAVGVGIRWIRSAHDVAMSLDGIVTLKNRDHNRTAHHVLDKFSKEGAFFVNFVKTFSFLL